MEISLKVENGEFNQILDQYIAVSKKALPVILNTKAFHVARKACWRTKRASKEDIKRFMSKLVTVTSERRVNPETGRKKKFKNYNFSQSKQGVPELALLINSNRGDAGKKGLYGPAMRKAMERELARRMSSIGFLASGWIHAIRGLDPKAEEKARSMAIRGVKQYGVPKGDYKAATDTDPSAMIENRAVSATDRGGWEKFMTEGLRIAFEEEARDMVPYIERKLIAETNALVKKL